MSDGRQQRSFVWDFFYLSVRRDERPRGSGTLSASTSIARSSDDGWDKITRGSRIPTVQQSDVFEPADRRSTFRLRQTAFSAGTVHNDAGDSNDPDLANFTGIALGDHYFKYPEEQWIDIKNPKALSNIEWRIQLAQSIGCDGIDPDNIDGYKKNSTTNAPQNSMGLVQSDYQAYFRSLSHLAKKYNLMIGQKNAPELTRDSVSFADFAVLEECLTSEHEDEPLDVCDSWQPYVQSNPGKPVFQIEYPVSVQPCDVLQDDAASCPQPILCPQEAQSQQNFTYYCTSDSTGGPPKTNDTGLSLVMKQDGSACGLGNWTEYCNVNSPIFVHTLTVDKPEDPEDPPVRRW